MIGEAFSIGCDSCSTRAFFDADAHTPQQAIVFLTVRKGWTFYGEICHCSDCPPLCPSCGAECDEDTSTCPVPCER